MSANKTTGRENHSHNFINSLAITLLVMIATLFIFTISRFDRLGDKIENSHNDLAIRITNINNRIDNLLSTRAVVSGLLSEGSYKRILTDQGKIILENEQDLTSALYSVYDNKPSTFPEDALYEIFIELGPSRIKEILSKYNILVDDLQGIVVSFYGGVRHGKYLERRPYLKQ